MRTLELQPEYIDVISAQTFLELYGKSTRDIETAIVIPPRLGRKGFGRILVKRKNAVYRMAEHNALNKASTTGRRAKTKKGRKSKTRRK